MFVMRQEEKEKSYQRAGVSYSRHRWGLLVGCL